MVAYTFSPGTQEAEVGGSLNFKPNLQSEFQGNQGYKETLSWKKKKKEKGGIIYPITRILVDYFHSLKTLNKR